jgi:hypothetical protein
MAESIIMKRMFLSLLWVVSAAAFLLVGHVALADSSAGAASASASVRITVNIPVNTLLRVSSSDAVMQVDSQANISSDATSASLGCDEAVSVGSTDACASGNSAFYTLTAL